jgi:hypothetical protein
MAVAFEHRVQQTKEGTACLVDRTADAFAFFVAVQDRQFTAP